MRSTTNPDSAWVIRAASISAAMMSFRGGQNGRFNGAADFTMPMDGDYVFFIRGAPWLDSFTPGEYGVSPVFAVPAP